MAQLLNMARATVTFLTLFIMFVYRNILYDEHTNTDKHTNIDEHINKDEMHH